MSTKTTFKRVALVAAVAAAFGGLSTVAANANGFTNGNGIIWAQTGDGFTNGGNGLYTGDATHLGSASLQGVAGPVNTVTVEVAADAGNHAAGVTSAPSTTTSRAIVTVSGASASIASTSVTSAVVNTAGTNVTIPAANNNGGVTINTPAVGTIVVSVYQETGASTGIFSSTAAETVTITVAATASTGTFSVANSTFYDTTTTGTATANLTTEPSLPDTVATSDTGFAAHYSVALNDALANPMPSSTAYSVTLSGPGLLTAGDTHPGAGSRVLSNTGSTVSFYIWPDGTSGVTTVSFYVGSTLLGTHTVTFSGTTIASLKAATTTPIIQLANVSGFTSAYSEGLGTVTANGATANVAPVYVTAADAAGNAISGSTGITVASSNTAVATVGTTAQWDVAAGYYFATVTPVAEGSAVITFSDTATGKITATQTVKVAKAVVNAVTASTDASSYTAGTKVTYTVAATDAAGNAIPDGTYTGFYATAPTTNVVFQSFNPAVNAVFTGGTSSSTGYAPVTGGSVSVIGGTLGASTALFTTAEASAVVPNVNLTVTGVADSQASAATDAANEATDAANEATDAANAATDAANAAADAADAATAAAQDASAQAQAALAAVNALSAKITVLAAQIAKIIKKLGA